MYEMYLTMWSFLKVNLFDKNKNVLAFSTFGIVKTKVVFIAVEFLSRINWSSAVFFELYAILSRP